jgi:hypothetical protein
MVVGGGQFDPDKATELDRFIFRAVTGFLGTGIAVFSVALLVGGLMGNLEKVAMAGVGFVVLGASVWVWRWFDRRMTRAIEARRAERRAASGEANNGRSDAPAHDPSSGHR